MAVRRRKPKDQSSQFTSMGWASFDRHHNLAHSKSRRGNCHDNAVAESLIDREARINDPTIAAALVAIERA